VPTNTEIVLDVFETLSNGDWDGARDIVHEDFVWTNDENTAQLTGVTVEIKGQDELFDFWCAFFDQWDEWQMSHGEPIESESGKVFMPVHFSAQVKGHDAPVEFNFFQVWEVKDGKPSRSSIMRTREAALASAGIDDGRAAADSEPADHSSQA
jgi:ketosteroid isomerase-like protein